MSDQAAWIEADSQTNAVATATKAAASSRQHIVYGVSASFSATATALLQIKDGTTVVWEGYVYDKESVDFPRGIAMTRGGATSAVLAAGGGGIVGKVNLHGTTR